MIPQFCGSLDTGSSNSCRLLGRASWTGRVLQDADPSCLSVLHKCIHSTRSQSCTKLLVFNNLTGFQVENMQQLVFTSLGRWWFGQLVLYFSSPFKSCCAEGVSLPRASAAGLAAMPWQSGGRTHRNRSLKRAKPDEKRWKEAEKTDKTTRTWACLIIFEIWILLNFSFALSISFTLPEFVSARPCTAAEAASGVVLGRCGGLLRRLLWHKPGQAGLQSSPVLWMKQH